MGNYIHHNFNNFDGIGIPNMFSTSQIIQERLNMRNSQSDKTSYKRITVESAELLNLVRDERGIENVLSNSLKEVERNLSNGIDMQSFEQYFKIDENPNENFFNNINNILNDNGAMIDFKTRIEGILNTISLQLGRDNYGELGKMIIMNIKNNYGYEVSEQQIYSDFLMNCDNKKFSVNKNYVGKLTDSINKIYLMSKSLPLLGKQGNLSFKVKTLNEIGNKSVGWINKCADVVKDIAISKVAAEVRHEIAVMLKDSLESFKKAGAQIEVDGDLQSFINNNIKEVQRNFEKQTNGIKITTTSSYVEISIDMSANYNQLTKEYNGLKDVKPIKASKKFLENINYLEGATEEGILNLSAAHADSQTQEQELASKFDKAEKAMAQNLILNELLEDDKSEIYVVNGRPYDFSQIVNIAMNNDGSIKYSINFDRSKLVSLNRWESVYKENWDNAYLRSSKNEMVQQSNIMTYEFNLLNTL